MQCLSAIPNGVAVHYSKSMPLNEWRRHGSFQVTGCSKKQVVIESAGVEIGTALLSDAEHLLDHAAEHQAMIHDLIVGASWHSPAWTVVTGYYWAFFSALAITRLTGHSAWFLDRSAITELRLLAGSAVQPPAGALRLAVGPYVSATNREIVLRPTKLQMHDAVWQRFKELTFDVFNVTDELSNGLEYRLFWCMYELAHRLGADWPSKVRNIINYRPGRAYREVIRTTEIDIAKYLRRATPFRFESAVSDFEDHLVKIKAGKWPEQEVPLLCRLLVLFAIILAAISTELHEEMIDRTSTDRRWLDLRHRFFQLHCPGIDGAIWPLRD